MNIQIFPVTAFQQNCSIIWDDNKHTAVIDPGGDIEQLVEFIAHNKLTVEKILLTHGHLDHVGGAQQLKQYFNTEIIGPHENDKFLFDSLPQQSQRLGLERIAPFLPDNWLDERDGPIQIGDIQFNILYLPGHSPGHIGFIDYTKKIAFTGDVLFKNSIGRTDLPGGNTQQLLGTIKQKLFPLPDEFLIIPGHGEHTTIGQEKMNNPFFK